MDSSTLTAFITPFLPSLLNVEQGTREATTERAASEFGAAAWQKAQTVWAILSPKVEAKAAAKEATVDVANNPKDEDSQAALRVQLKKILASDQALTNQLTLLLAENTQPRPTTQITQTITGNKNQAIGQVSGGQVFGNVTGSVIISGSGNSVTSSNTTQPSAQAAAPAVKTILVLAANPKDTSQLRLGEEVRELQEGLRRSQQRDRFHIEQRWAVTPRDIQRALLDCHPQIVHFSGHGVGRESSSAEQLNDPADPRKAILAGGASQPEGLLFEDKMGNAKLVSAEAIAALFSLFDDEIECVLLNACYSATQADAIARHIPHVVGMKKAIGDRAAITFSVGFYDALLAGQSVEFAYKFGCNAIQMEGIPEHLTPILKKCD